MHPTTEKASKKKSKDKTASKADSSKEEKSVNKRPDIEELKNKFLKKRKKE